MNKRQVNLTVLGFSLAPFLLLFQNCSGGFSGESQTVSKFLGQGLTSKSTSMGVGLAPVVGRLEQVLYKPSVPSLADALQVNPSQGGPNGKVLFTLFAPSTNVTLNQPITSWNLGSFTNLWTTEAGSQYGVSDGQFGSTSVQYANGEYGLVLNSKGMPRTDGNPNTILNIQATSWLSGSLATRPFATPDGIMQMTADVQIPVVAVDPGVIAYTGLGTLIQDTSSGKSFFYGSNFYDSRGFSNDVDFVMSDDWEHGTGLAMVTGKTETNSPYVSLDASSSTFQPTTWSGYKHFAINIDRVHFMKGVHQIKAQDPSYATLSENPADYVVTLGSLGQELSFTSTTPGLNGLFGMSYKNLAILRYSSNVGSFSESDYLTMYSDVAAAVANGGVSSGFAHYQSNGAREGRNPNYQFNEQAYRAANPDVAASIANGGFVSGYAHWLASGRSEGRAATPVQTNAIIDDLKWSYAGALPGLQCLQVNEPSDPYTWNDNFLCGTKDWGLKWSYAGPIAGMTCTQINEPSDPDTWNDNYLCAPVDYGFQWSFAGPIPGLKCVQINEPADPDTWQDNYLCTP